MAGVAQGEGRVLRHGKPGLAGDEVMLCSINRDAALRIQLVSMSESYPHVKESTGI